MERNYRNTQKRKCSRVISKKNIKIQKQLQVLQNKYTENLQVALYVYKSFRTTSKERKWRAAAVAARD